MVNMVLATLKLCNLRSLNERVQAYGTILCLSYHEIRVRYPLHGIDDSGIPLDLSSIYFARALFDSENIAEYIEHQYEYQNV